MTSTIEHLALTLARPADSFTGTGCLEPETPTVAADFDSARFGRRPVGGFTQSMASLERPLYRPASTLSSVPEVWR